MILVDLSPKHSEATERQRVLNWLISQPAEHRASLAALSEKARSDVARDRRKRRQQRELTISKYGLSWRAYRDLVFRFNNRCGCCWSDTPGDRAWAVDHDHQTGRVRGILCFRCNAGIGLLGDTAERLERAIYYLRQR